MNGSNTSARNVVALVLAGGNIGGYGLLTQNRAKAALPFLANYRIIDFPLSSLRNSNILRIGLIIQYLPASLIEHVGVGDSWDLHGYGRTLKIMPPFVGVEKTAWYKGTADALFQNMNFIADMKPEHVIVLSGEHFYKFDFAAAVAAHRDRDADITMVTRDVPPEKCLSRFGYVVSDENGKVTEFVEKPAKPPNCTISTGIFIFRTSHFIDLLRANSQSEGRNLARDILTPAVRSLDCITYPMTDDWQYLADIGEYFDVQMNLISGDGYNRLRQWNVVTNFEYRGVGFAPAALYGESAEISDILAGPGSEIYSNVEHSILSPGVIIRRGATVRNCILMNDCIVEEGAVLEGVVSDKDAYFGPGAIIGIETDGGGEPAGVSRHAGPLTLIGKGVHVAAEASVPKGAQVQHGERFGAKTVAV